MDMKPDMPPENMGHLGWRAHLHQIIFEADTPAGKAFDVVLIVCILLSVCAVMLESIAAVRVQYGGALSIAEWVFTILFTIEYFLRLLCVGKPIKYARSFFGVVDLLAIIPTYASLLLPGSHYLAVIRLLRILRIFRLFKLVQYLNEARLIAQALRASSRKIAVFLFAVLTLIVIFGSLIYMVEGEENGFVSIPRSIYWTIVTLTTVGYGDISPKTGFGQFLASIVMILGYGIIAVPTGIVTVEMTHGFKKEFTTQSCPVCGAEGHDADADYCKFCGGKL
jgi:voltage-gated potassium channel